MSTPEQNSVKKCTNHIRGCRVILEEDYKFKKCSECLRKDRERDYRRRHAVNEIVPTRENHKACSACCQEYPLDHFQGLKSETKTCKACRENNQKQDAKRDKEHINELARTNCKKPERLAVKQEWKENNYEKVVEYWQKSRQRKIEENTEEYLKRNAENQKRWRENNPEKVKKVQQEMRNNISNQYTSYKRGALNRNLDFELDLEQFESIVTKPCYFCGEFTKNCKINGIDRFDSMKSYTLDNCVPSCHMCNMLKNTLNEYTFLKRIEHILVFQNIIQEGNLHPELFSDFRGATFNDYTRRADNKNLEFTVSSHDFQKLRDTNCYICGKETNETTHINGIDRYDNNIGYIPENCRSCCANCNFMKKHFTYDEFIQKLILIHNQHKEKVMEPVVPNGYMNPSNKKTKQELQIHSLEQREQRKESLKQKYTEEEIKKNAALIAERRRNK